MALGALRVCSSVVVGCGDSGDDSGAGKAGSQSSAGSSGRNNTANGGNDVTRDAGAMTGSSGSKNDGGRDGGGTASGGLATNGGASDNGSADPGSMGGADQGPGGEGLGTSDGITGTFDDTAHTHTFNATNVAQQTKTVVIGATSAQYPSTTTGRFAFCPSSARRTAPRVPVTKTPSSPSGPKPTSLSSAPRPTAAAVPST